MLFGLFLKVSTKLDGTQTALESLQSLVMKSAIMESTNTSIGTVVNNLIHTLYNSKMELVLIGQVHI